MKKKGAEMSLNVIIVAIILIIVLIVVIYIFLSQSKTAANETTSIATCQARNGNCLPSCPSGTISLGQFSCPTSQYCCVSTSLG